MRAAITAWGAVSAFGAGVSALEAGLREGRTGVRKCTRFPTESMCSQLAAQSPTFGVTGARFENDRFVMDSGATLPAAAAANTDRGLAAETPEDAIFFADGPSVGKGLANGVTYLKGILAASGGIRTQQLDQVESALGGDFGSFVSWMGDTALVAGDTATATHMLSRDYAIQGGREFQIRGAVGQAQRAALGHDRRHRLVGGAGPEHVGEVPPPVGGYCPD